MLQKLLDDHRQLNACADRLGALLAQPVPPDSEKLADARWALSSTMMQHLAFEARHLYTHLEQDERAEVRAVGVAFQSELSTTFDPYVEHVKAWTPDRVLADWDGYRRESLQMLNLLKARIAREERELFPYVLLRGIETQRGAPTRTNWARDAFAIKDSIAGRL